MLTALELSPNVSTTRSSCADTELLSSERLNVGEKEIGSSFLNFDCKFYKNLFKIKLLIQIAITAKIKWG